MMPLILNTLSATAYELMTMFAQGTSIKKITGRNIQMIIYFKQGFTQGLWLKEDPHLQLPHFNENVIKRLRKRRIDLKVQGKNQISEFCKLPIETIRELDLFEGDKEK